MKQNIVKKSKTVIDAGHKYIKLLGVSYAGRKITIAGAQKLDSEQLFREQDGELNCTELARIVERVIGHKKRAELSISLPAHMAEYKIAGIKNKKVSELRSHIEKEHLFSGKTSPATHEIDFAYLGSREENGDTVHYCLIGAVSKSSIFALTDEFDKRKMRITTVTFPIYNLICLSQLFADDYKNKLLIDFGASGTRVVAVCDGVPVYSRTIGVGFQTYVDKLFTAQDKIGRPEIIKMLCAIGEMSVLTGEHIKRYFSVVDQRQYYALVSEVSAALAKEIARVIELCDNNHAPIAKIVCNDYPVKGFESRLQAGNMEVERFDLGIAEAVSGKNFTIQLGNVNADPSFNGALGLAIHTLL